LSCSEKLFAALCDPRGALVRRGGYLRPSGPLTDLWWTGNHPYHGGNEQVVSTPDGWPLWTSDARSGREHDISVARADSDLLARRLGQRWHPRLGRCQGCGAVSSLSWRRTVLGSMSRPAAKVSCEHPLDARPRVKFFQHAVILIPSGLELIGRTIDGVTTCIAQPLLALTAAMWHNVVGGHRHQPGYGPNLRIHPRGMPGANRVPPGIDLTVVAESVGRGVPPRLGRCRLWHRCPAGVRGRRHSIHHLAYRLAAVGRLRVAVGADPRRLDGLRCYGATRGPRYDAERRTWGWDIAPRDVADLPDDPRWIWSMPAE